MTSLAVLAVLATLALAGSAFGSPFRRLAPSTVAFATDGTRYAAWQVTKSAPLVLLDTRTGKQMSVPGCSIGGVEELAGGPVAAAGRFLAGCEGGASLVNAATGMKTRLPEASGGEWKTVGSRYVEGSANRRECTHSASEERTRAREGLEGEPTCIALYDISTRAVSYRPESQVPNLDRPGAPVVCPALRGKLFAHGRVESSTGGFAFGENMLAESVLHGEAPVKSIRLRSCHGTTRTISTASGPRDLLLAGGLLTWDTGHSVNQEAGIHQGDLWAYQPSTGRRRVLPLPQTTVSGGQPMRGVFGYSSHAGKTLFWIAATSIDVAQLTTVESSAVYSAAL